MTTRLIIPNFPKRGPCEASEGIYPVIGKGKNWDKDNYSVDPFGLEETRGVEGLTKALVLDKEVVKSIMSRPSRNLGKEDYL